MRLCCGPGHPDQEGRLQSAFSWVTGGPSLCTVPVRQQLSPHRPLPGAQRAERWAQVSERREPGGELAGDREGAGSLVAAGVVSGDFQEESDQN